MRKKENPITVRSRIALMAAATELLDDRSASEISIKDVVEAAGMSRPTFYQHFSDVGAVAAAAGLVRLEAMFAAVESPEVHDASGLEEQLRRAFAGVVARMSERATFYFRVHESGGGIAFHAAAVAATAAWLRGQPILASHSREDRAFWEFIAGGIVWTVTRYLAELCKDPAIAETHPEVDLARIVAAMLQHVPSPATALA